MFIHCRVIVTSFANAGDTPCYLAITAVCRGHEVCVYLTLCDFRQFCQVRRQQLKLPTITQVYVL